MSRVQHRSTEEAYATYPYPFWRLPAAAPASVHSKAAVVLQQALSARVGTRVNFMLEGNIVAAGRPAADLLTLVEDGTLTMCYFSASYLAERVAEWALLDLPFTITDRARAYAMLDGPR